MIRYALKCPDGHGFESWFQSGEAFERLLAAGHLSCAVCGAGGVEKALMAPSVAQRETRASNGPPPDLSAPGTPMEAWLAALRRHVESNSTYVGGNFAKEARAIHAGEAPERMIHGETNGEEARKLLEEGIPIAPLPFLPTRKAN